MPEKLCSITANACCHLAVRVLNCTFLLLQNNFLTHLRILRLSWDKGHEKLMLPADE